MMTLTTNAVAVVVAVNDEEQVIIGGVALPDPEPEPKSDIFDDVMSSLLGQPRER